MGPQDRHCFEKTILTATQYVFFISGRAEPFSIVSHLDRKKSPPALSSSLVLQRRGPHGLFDNMIILIGMPTNGTISQFPPGPRNKLRGL